MRNNLFSLVLAISLILSFQWVNAQTTLVNESFDNITSGIPNGWDNSDYNCSASYVWQSSADGYGGTRGVYFNVWYVYTGYYSTLKTPVLNLNGQFFLRFKYKNPTSNPLEVRYSSDGGQTYATVIANNLYSSDWTEVEFDLSSYSGTNSRIVFYAVSDYGYSNMYIDDVLIESVPTCRGPQGIFASNLSTNSVNLNWQMSTQGDNPQYLQMTVTDEHGTVVLSNSQVRPTATPYSLTGLSANTTYTVSMRGDCDSTMAGYSKYSTFTFTTACNVSSLPYNENFDALTGVPDCTHSLNVALDPTSYSTSGKSLKLSRTTSSSAYIVFPTLNHNANDIEMGFFAKSSTSSTLIYQVGIVSDLSDIEGSFEPLFIDSLKDNTTWHEVRMNTALASVSASPVSMMVLISDGDAASLNIDNVSIHAIPSCVRPEQLRAYNPTSSTVDLAWTTSIAATHIVEITDNSGTVTSQVVTSNPCTVTSLQPNSAYSFRLRAICAVADTSEYTSTLVTARTLCVPLTVATWTEDAESTTGSSLPDCWTYGYFAHSTAQYSFSADMPFVTSNSYSHSGSRCFQLQDMSAGNFSYLTSPGFTVDSANKYELSIWVKRDNGNSSNGEGLRLFASNSPDDVTSAQQLGFINRTVGNAPIEVDGAGWYQYTYPISLTGTVYIIIEGESKYGSDTYFDDVAVQTAATCLPSGDILMGTPTTTDNTITWTAGPGNETSWALAYELMVGSIVVESDSLVVTSPTYTFSGLSASTSYTLKARVYSLCSASDMARPKKLNASFATQCGTITAFPYAQDFEAGSVPPVCWSQQVVATASSSYATTSTWSVSTSPTHNSNYAAAISDANVGARTALITGEMNFTDPNGYQVSYWQYRPANSYQSKTDEAMHIYVCPTDSLDENTAVEIGVVNNHYFNDPVEAAAGWYRYTFDIPASVTGIQHIAFCYHNQYGSGSYIDDILVTVAPSCRVIAGSPVVLNIRPTAADIMITDTSAHTWDISYGPVGTAAGAGTVVTVNDTNIYTINGLTANTTYDVYVRRNCGTEFSDWSASPITFTALCPDIYASYSDIDAHSFKVSTTVQDWDISYGPLGTQPSSGTQINVTGADNYTITGLNPSTNYVFYVRNNCGTGYSDWSYSYTIKTTTVPDTIPYGTGFENDLDNDGWTIVNGASTANNTFIFGTDAAGVASGSKALYIQSNGSYGYLTGSSTKTFAYRTLYFGSGVHNVTFRWKCTGGEGSGNYVYDFARVMLVPASENIPGGEQGTNLSSTTFPDYLFAFDPQGKNYIGLDPGDADGWNTYNGDIDMTGHEGTYNFVVMWSNDYTSGNNYPIAIDNLSISQVSCNRPSVMASATSSTGTTINVITQTSTEWEIAVSSTPIDIFTSVTGDVYQQVSQAPAVLSGLTPNTLYYFTARAICSAGDTSAWADPMTVRTSCDAFSVPYNESFEDAGALNCWPSFGTQLPQRNTTYKYSGAASCKISEATAVSPQLNVVTLASYMLSGWCYSTSDSTNFSVGVIVDPQDVSTYQGLGQVTIPAANTWTEFTTYFNLLADPDYSDFFNAQHFAIVAASGVTVYVDNIYLGPIPTCPKPTETSITNVTAHSFDISWTENGTATSWKIKAIPANASQPTIDTVVANNPTSISGLNAASSYSVQIAAICSATDTSFVTECGSFTTACDVVNAPYSEDFETMPADAIPNCWDNSASTCSGTNNYKWGVVLAGSNKSIRMNNYWCSSNGNAIIASPQINLTGSLIGHELKFDYCHQASCPAFSVEISTDDSNWTSLGTYSRTSFSSDHESPASWTTASLSLAAFNGNVIRLRFNAAPDYNEGAIFIDNVRIINLRNCSDVQSVSVASTGETVATVLFSDSASTHTQWQYVYGTTGFDPNTATPVLVTNDTIQLTGLTASTGYDIYVRSYCDATEQSNWVKASFRTTATPASFPYVCHFDDPIENAQWQTATSYPDGNFFTIGSEAGALSTGETAALYVTDGTGYVYNQNNTSSAGAYRLFYFQPTQYNLSFAWKCPGGESSYDYARFYLVPASDPIYLPSPGYYSAFGWPADMIALDGGSLVNNKVPEWNYVEVSLDMTNRSGSYYLVFVWTNDYGYSAGTTPLAVNNIQISELSCFAPGNISIPDSTITQTSAVVNYDDPNTAGTPVRYWVNTTGSRTDTLFSSVVTASPITLTGLSPAMTYTIFMKAECDASSESPVASASFSTACGIISSFPLTEGFEGNFPPNCWTSTPASSGLYWDKYSPYYVPTSYVHSGNYSAYVTGASSTSLPAFLSTPAMQLDSLREYFVSLYMYRASASDYTDELKVYLSDVPNSVAGATLLNTTVCGGAPVADMYNITCDIPAYTSGIKYIIFAGNNTYNGTYIDDVTVDVYPVCRDLAGVTIDATTASTITASVNIGPNHQGVIFAYAPVTATSVADTIGSVYSTTGTAVITGLTTNTTYKVYARGVCSATDSTVWTAEVTATTMDNDCFEPQNVHAVGLVGATDVTLAWGGAPLANGYECILLGTAFADTVLTGTINIQNLTPNTAYTFRVRTLCAYDTSAWVSYNFTTTPLPATLPYLCGFENTTENNQWNLLNSQQANTFIIGAATSHGGGTSLYITDGGGTNAYNTSSSAVSFATRFFTLTAGQYAYSYDWNCNGESYYDYARVFIAPSSLAFTPGTLPDGVSTSGIPSGCYALDDNYKLNQKTNWQTQFGTVDITADGNYNLVLVWRNDNSDGANPPVAFDNIMFRQLTCIAPTISVLTDSTTETSACIVVTYNPNQSDTLIYSLSYGNLADAFLTDTVVGSDTIALTGLTASTGYTFYLKCYCGENDESFYTQVSFRTRCAEMTLPYTQSFENDVPTTYSGPGMIEVICWNDLNASLYSYPGYYASSYHATDGNLSLQTTCSTQTPLYLLLPRFGDIGSCRISFDCAYYSLLESGTYSVGYLTDPADASTFVSAFTATKTVESQMLSYVADIANIPAGARLAFEYSIGLYDNYWAWLDNIRVSQIVQGPTFTDTICFGEPYTGHGFNVPSSGILVGDNLLTRTKLGSQGTPDTIYTANVYQRAKIEEVSYDTLCQGEPLIWGGRVFQNPTTRAYTQNFTSFTGCDSSVTLYLTVLPTFHEIDDTICNGDVYQFGTQLLTQPGDYTKVDTTVYGCSDTTLLHLAVIPTTTTLNERICKGDSYTWHGSTYTATGTYSWSGPGIRGCMMNETLNLTVIDGDSTDNVTICQGGSYQFNDTVITTAGTYVRRFFDVTLGCYITVTLNVRVNAAVPVDVYDHACEGIPYSNYGVPATIITQDTVIIRNTKTQFQCDSITNIHITYHATAYTDTFAYLKSGQSITWYGNTYNKPGDYKETLRSVHNCDSVVTLHVIFNDGVSTVADVNMTIVPNPVNAGATALVYGEFGDVERVEILNNFGQLIDTFVPETYPIEVNGISASGIYYVRVTTKTGSVHLQKLMVK